MQSILQKISYRDETWAQLANYSKFFVTFKDYIVDNSSQGDFG